MALDGMPDGMPDKLWYHMKLVGANKRFDPRLNSYARAQEHIENAIVHLGLRYDVEIFWAAVDTKPQKLLLHPCAT